MGRRPISRALAMLFGDRGVGSSAARSYTAEPRRAGQAEPDRAEPSHAGLGRAGGAEPADFAFTFRSLPRGSRFGVCRRGAQPSHDGSLAEIALPRLCIGSFPPPQHRYPL